MERESEMERSVKGEICFRLSSANGSNVSFTIDEKKERKQRVYGLFFSAVVTRRKYLLDIDTYKRDIQVDNNENKLFENLSCLFF